MIALGTDKLLAHVEAGVGWVTFNQPERRNAVSLEMWRALGDAMEAFDADDAVRVVVLKGAGDKAFASGADISEFAEQRANSAQRQRYGEISGRGIRALSHCRKPVIASIRGYCVGGGLLIALAADMRFASSGSRFGIPAAKLGLGYDYAGVASLARLVGPARTADILFSARLLDAAEALRYGLVEQVYDEADGVDMHARVTEYARAVSRNAPLTLRAIKASLRAYAQAAPRGDLAHVEQLVERCYDSEDYREGRQAFLEKRAPEFHGR